MSPSEPVSPFGIRLVPSDACPPDRAFLIAHSDSLDRALEAAQIDPLRPGDLERAARIMAEHGAVASLKSDHPCPIGWCGAADPNPCRHMAAPG